jgi:hypothetical protein
MSAVTGDEPLPRLPPPWVPLTDLMRWVSRLFGLGGCDVEGYLIMRLRKGPHLRIVSPDGGYVRYMDGPDDWDTISDDRVKWDDGYAIAPAEWPRPPQRYPIEARLESVETIVGWWRTDHRSDARAALGAVPPGHVDLADGMESATAAENAVDQSDAELKQWYVDWSKENHRASNEDVEKAAATKFPEKRITRQAIRDLRRLPDGTPRPRGRKSGKPESEFR